MKSAGGITSGFLRFEKIGNFQFAKLISPAYKECNSSRSWCRNSISSGWVLPDFHQPNLFRTRQKFHFPENSAWT